jgi:hypothetical protein
MIDFEEAKRLGTTVALCKGIADRSSQLVTRQFVVDLDLPNSPDKVYVGGYVTERVSASII